MDTDVSEDVVCLNDEGDEVDGPQKFLCLFGDARSVPIDVDADEYDVFPSRPPEEWYERYCLDDNLTPECKALHEKAIDFYSERELVGGAIKLEIPEANITHSMVHSASVQESEGVERRKANWFKKMDVKMTKYGATRRCDSSLGTDIAKRVRGSLSKQGEVSVVPKKCGRGRLSKQIDSLVTVEKGGRGRPQKKNVTKEIESFVTIKKRGRGRPPKKSNVSSVAVKRGRGRPKKQGDTVINVENVKSGQISKKRARSPQMVVVEFAAYQLCGGCFQKIGKKLGQPVKGKLLRMEFVTGYVDDDNVIVKRPRGRPRKV